MPPPSRLLRTRTSFLVAGALVLLALLALGILAFGPRLIAPRLRAAAHARGLEASWDALVMELPAGARLRSLRLIDAAGDTVLSIDSLRVALDPLPLLLLRARFASVDAAHVRLAPPTRRAADPDTLAPEEPSTRGRPDRSRRVHEAADRLARTLLLPARRLPELALRDVRVGAGDGEAALAIERLDLHRARGAMALDAEGALERDPPTPFALELRYGDEDRLTGRAIFGIPDLERGTLDSLLIRVDGAVVQDRAHGVVRMADSTRVTIGRIRLRIGGSLERRGPHVRFALAANDLDAPLIQSSLPRMMLGPLLDLSVRGSFDYRISFDLDVSAPDSVRFDADVIPHGLALDPAHTRLNLTELSGPFVARIHLPRDRIVIRDLSAASPHYRPLEAIDSLLTHAVLTNEDGGFFRHHGFNTEAVRGAIADNVRAGAYRRGAGTITMQLVRNLYLGHARTLSRKAQEVVLSWVLEHLVRLDKRRILEIYINIIEWGPDVFGADEAAFFYFGHDAGRVSVDEALFLATVVPAPTKWRYRFDTAGELRPFERAQMHFIGRAMIAKGWLDPAQLPGRDALRVELRGPAREVLFPRDPTALDSAHGQPRSN